MLTIVVMFSNLQIPCIWRNIYWFALLHRKKILQYGLGEILLPIIRRVIF
jgi:hypothetical protein